MQFHKMITGFSISFFKLEKPTFFGCQIVLHGELLKLAKSAQFLIFILAIDISNKKRTNFYDGIGTGHELLTGFFVFLNYLATICK